MRPRPPGPGAERLRPVPPLRGTGRMADGRVVARLGSTVARRRRSAAASRPPGSGSPRMAARRQARRRSVSTLRRSASGSRRVAAGWGRSPGHRSRVGTARAPTRTRGPHWPAVPWSGPRPAARVLGRARPPAFLDTYPWETGRRVLRGVRVDPGLWHRLGERGSGRSRRSMARPVRPRVVARADGRARTRWLTGSHPVGRWRRLLGAAGRRQARSIVGPGAARHLGRRSWPCAAGRVGRVAARDGPR